MKVVIEQDDLAILVVVAEERLKDPRFLHYRPERFINDLMDAKNRALEAQVVSCVPVQNNSPSRRRLEF